MQVALVDLSNVCRGEGAPAWDRYLLVRHELDRRGFRVKAIADKSLTFRLPPLDRGHLEAAVRRNEVELVPYADPHLIGRALADDETIILTNDRFRALRRLFPTLDGFERVLAFRFVGQRVDLYRAPLEVLGSADVSHAEEREEAERLGFRTPADRELLRWDWRCGTEGCPVAEQQLLNELPICEEAAAYCPCCDEPLERLGLAVGGIELKLLVGGLVLERLALSAGQSVVLGRSSGAGTVDVSHLLGAQDAGMISRRHLQVTNHDGRLRVRDEGSRNGSAVLRGTGAVDALVPGTTLVVDTSARVSLAGVVEIQLSGRRYARGAALEEAGIGTAGETKVGAAVWNL
jgi:hypothetical protein